MVKVLFDTSAIVAGTWLQHPHHDSCFHYLLMAKTDESVQGYLSAHSLAETYSVLTRLPIQPQISPANAQEIILRLLQYLNVVPLVMDDYQAAIARLVALKVPGGAIFDALIAQAAVKIKADQLLTLNSKHFTRLGDEVSGIVTLPE